MDKLIIYYSFTGNNRRLAKRLAYKLKAESEEIIEIKKKRSFFSCIIDTLFKRKPKIELINSTLSNFDMIILAAPVWAGHPASPLISFINDYKERIKNYSFISLSGGAVGENTKINDILTSLMGRAPKYVKQLYINNILPEQDKNKMKKTSEYKITDDDIDNRFKNEINDFIKNI